MAGIHLLEMMGALIRWCLFGFKKSDQIYLKDEKNEGVIPRKFFLPELLHASLHFSFYSFEG